MSAELKASLWTGLPGGFALDVTIEAPPGITVLFGPSGAGKSTTLRAIAGLERPAKGVVTLGETTWFDAGREVDVPVHQRALAYVFQSLALFPHLSAQDNVEYGIDRRLPKAERRKLALNFLTRMRVAHVADRRPRTLSGGEAQRVALARAFAAQPDLLLLDEPFSNLDRLVRTELLEALRTVLDDTHTTSILVTHDVRDAVDFGSDLLLIAEGRVQRQGSIAQVLADPGSDWTRRFLACGLGQATHQEPRHENS